VTEKKTPAPARKAPAKRAAKKTAAPARKRGPITAPKPPVMEPVEVKNETPEEVPAVSDSVETDETPKNKPGRKPNVVGQANARFQKARASLARWEKRAAKIQNINDSLAAARKEFEEAKEEYETAFRASLDNLPVADDSDDDGDEDE
jgi:hypothetical protein